MGHRRIRERHSCARLLKGAGDRRRRNARRRPHRADDHDRKAGDGSAAEVYDEDVRAKLRKLVGELSHDGLNAIHKVVNYAGPQPAQGIVDIAREVGADVIVVGTRGHSAIGGLVVGSVTQRLLHVAPCPVLAVPPTARPAPELRELEAARHVG